MAFLRRVFGIANARIGEDDRGFKGRVSRSGGLFDFVNVVDVIRQNDVLIFREGIIKTLKCDLQALQNRRELWVRSGEQLSN
jgi:hypothetical protein